MHDFDPGIHPYPSGLFWTVPLRDDGVTVDIGDGTARMTAENVQLRDFFNIPNALLRFQHPTSFGATASFDIQWIGPATGGSPVTSPPGSSGRVFSSPVAITWSGQNSSGFRFESNPSGQTSFFGQLGEVRNGIFAK